MTNSVLLIIWLAFTAFGILTKGWYFNLIAWLSMVYLAKNIADPAFWWFAIIASAYYGLVIWFFGKNPSEEN